jgi:hypothetical protein
VQDWQTALLGQQKLWVSRPKCAGYNHGVWAAKVFSCVTDVNLSTKLSKRFHIGGIPQVGAGYFVPHADGESRDARHSATTDPDEMHGT